MSTISSSSEDEVVSGSAETAGIPIPIPRPAPTFAIVERLFLSVGCEVSEGIMPQ